MKVYKLYYFCDDSAETNRYVFEQIELLTENGLRKRLRQAIIDEQLGEDTCDRFNLRPDMDLSWYSTKDIIDIFRSDGYEIQESTLED